MSFKTRMEQLDTDILTLENAEPFVLTQVFPPNQKDWEDAWIAAGNTLPIPTTQELYWYDGTDVRGEFKTLPDQFSMLARSQSEGFQIRDIAGWEDDDHLIVFVVRDDPNAPQGACRMYMDGTLEQLSFTAFTPDGLLAYDVTNGYLWYVEGNDVKYIDVVSEAITTVLTTTGELPEWRFFVVLGDGSGDAYFGAESGADPNRSLYFWDESAGGSATNVLSTFNPGTGAVNADRPVAVTSSYVFLSEIDSRAAFDGNLVHQILRSGYTYNDTVDHGTYSNEVRVLVYDSDYAADTINVLTAHLTPSVMFQDWNITCEWDGSTTNFTANQPHLTLLRNLRNEINDHNLDYHVGTRLYYDPSFTADGGDEEHYNNVGVLVLNPSGTKYLIHDLGWHTWTVDDAPDIWIYGDSSGKIYRVSDWQDFNADVLIIATGSTTSSPDTIDVTEIPPEYGLIEFIHEAYTSSGAGTGRSYLGDPNGGILRSNNASALNHGDPATQLFSELSTNASLCHYYIIRNKLSENYEITYLPRHSVRTNFGAPIINDFSEGFFVIDNEEILQSFPVFGSAGFLGNRWIVRAWRTQPRMKHEGSEYDPSMA